MAKQYHFIGIGGAGMSAIASVMLQQGLPVSGSDLKESRYTRVLAEQGASIHIGHSADNVLGAEVVIRSTAIPDRNPELIAAQEAGITILKRAEMLGRTAAGKQFLAIAGTHGKTTTSSMVSLLLSEVGMDPTFVIGGELNDIGTNARVGKGDLFVAEADESDGSFLLLSPHSAVITNIDSDHLDHYGDFSAVISAFAQFLTSIPAEGRAYVCGDDHTIMDIVSMASCAVATYGTTDGCRIRAEDIVCRGLGSQYTLVDNGKRLGVVHLAVPGRHNVVNSLAACGVALDLGLDPAVVIAAISKFTGVKRRFQLTGEINGLTVVDDYAHHPTEIKATLAAAKCGEWGRVVGVFQPHRYSRTQALMDEFAGAFIDADKVVITDVYSAGETPLPGVSGKTVVNAVLETYPSKDVTYLPRRDQVAEYLMSSSRRGDIVLTMGAGDIASVGEELVNKASS